MPSAAIRPLLLAILAFALGPAAAGQTCEPTAETDALVADLTEAGFEAVGACRAGDEALVTYENRRFRYDVRALEEVAEQSLSRLGVARVRVVPTRRGVRLIEHTTSGPDAGVTSLDVPADLPPTRNPTRGKLDVVVHPEVRAGFGNFDDPIQFDLALTPTLEMDVAPGLSVTGQVVVPIVAETGETSAQVRPGIVAVHQEARLPLDTFVRASAGRFTRDRYGVDVVASTFVQDGRGALTLRAGRTGFARFDGGDWSYSAVNTTTYAASVDYVVLPSYGLGVGATYAKYLSGEPGWRVDVRRSFGEADVAVFGLVTAGEPNVGGRITLPLPFRRHAAPRRARVRLADRLGVEYRYRRTVAETPDYDVRPVPWDPLGPVNPALLPYHLRRPSR